METCRWSLVPVRLTSIAPRSKQVLVVGGGDGVGGLHKIAVAVGEKLGGFSGACQLVVVCGKNEKVKKALESHRWPDNVCVTVQVRLFGQGPHLSFTIYQDHLARCYCYCLARAHILWGRLRSEERPMWQMCSVDDWRRSRQPAHPSRPARCVRGVHGVFDTSSPPQGFVSNMDDYMVAAEILVTKAGPGTIAEASILGVPTMLSGFLPGQEFGNIPYVVKGGFGAYEKDPVKLGCTVTEWLGDPKKLKAMSDKAAEVGKIHSGATLDIARDIAELVL